MRTTIRAVGLATLALALVGLTAATAFGQRGGGGRASGMSYGGWGGGPRMGYAGGWEGNGYGLGGYGLGGYGLGYYGGNGYNPGYYGQGYGYGLGGYGYGGYLDVGPAYYYTPPATGASGYRYTPPTGIVAAGYEAPQTPSRAASVAVRVPANAKIWFDDAPTKQEGENRLFSSPPLTTDDVCHYTIRAQWEDNGKTVDQTRRIEVRAGQTTQVDFTRPAPANEEQK